MFGATFLLNGVHRADAPGKATEGMERGNPALDSDLSSLAAKKFDGRLACHKPSSSSSTSSSSSSSQHGWKVGFKTATVSRKRG